MCILLRPIHFRETNHIFFLPEKSVNNHCLKATTVCKSFNLAGQWYLTLFVMVVVTMFKYMCTTILKTAPGYGRYIYRTLKETKLDNLLYNRLARRFTFIFCDSVSCEMCDLVNQIFFKNMKVKGNNSWRDT